MLKPQIISLLMMALTTRAAAQESTADARSRPSHPAPETGAVPTNAVRATPAKPPVPSWEQTGEWGWFVIGTSFVAGAILMGSGLAASCAGDPSCRQQASLAFWGGMGVAAVGSLIGITVLERGEHHGQDRSSVAGVEVTLSSTF